MFSIQSRISVEFSSLAAGTYFVVVVVVFSFRLFCLEEARDAGWANFAQETKRAIEYMLLYFFPSLFLFFFSGPPDYICFFCFHIHLRCKRRLFQFCSREQTFGWHSMLLYIVVAAANATGVHLNGENGLNTSCNFHF